MKLNVDCKCGKGKLMSESHIDDHYLITCDSCDNEYTVHYTGMDCLLEQHEYNNQLNDDIRILNANGSWYGKRHSMKDDQIQSELKGFKQIHFIDDGYEEYTYYQSGATFVSVKYNPVHKTHSLYKFVANEDGMPNLINHFFKK